MNVIKLIKRRKIFFLLTVPNAIMIMYVVRFIRKASFLNDPTLKLITVLLMSIIVELMFIGWINMEYFQRFLDRLNEPR